MKLRLKEVQFPRGLHFLICPNLTLYAQSYFLACEARFLFKLNILFIKNYINLLGPKTFRFFCFCFRIYIVRAVLLNRLFFVSFCFDRLTINKTI